MAVTSYSDLKAEIATHLDHDNLTSSIDTFIDLAEARHKRDIRIRQMIIRQSVTVNARYVDVPDGYLEGIRFLLLTDPATPLTYVSPEEMSRIRSETSGKPAYFTMGAQLEFDKTPDSSYSGEMLFFKEVEALSDSTISNAILERAPDAYLYGALLATAPFLMNDERIEVWASLYKSVVDGLATARRQERNVGRQVSRVAGATP